MSGKLRVYNGIIEASTARHGIIVAGSWKRAAELLNAASTRYFTLGYLKVYWSIGWFGILERHGIDSAREGVWRQPGTVAAGRCYGPSRPGERYEEVKPKVPETSAETAPIPAKNDTYVRIKDSKRFRVLHVDEMHGCSLGVLRKSYDVGFPPEFCVGRGRFITLRSLARLYTKE